VQPILRTLLHLFASEVVVLEVEGDGGKGGSHALHEAFQPSAQAECWPVMIDLWGRIPPEALEVVATASAAAKTIESAHSRY